MTVRFGVDIEFLRGNVLQLFTQALDVPVQLQVPWIDELPGAVTLADRAHPPMGRDQRRFSFALNEKIADAPRIADRERDGRKFAVLEIDRTFATAGLPRLRVPAPRLRFAFATRFEQNILSDSLPLDWQLASVTGIALDLTVMPLPEEGRPVGFTGAVGHFTMSADATPLDARVGESIHLVLRITGVGNLEFPNPPRLDQLDGFHLRGTLDEKGPAQRTLTYDLTPISTDVRALPPVAFSYFDSGDSPGYRTLRTPAIALSIGPSPSGGPGRGIAAAGSVAALMATAIAVVIGLVGLFAAFWIRRRKR